MTYHDFAVKWDSETEPESQLLKKIFFSLFLARIKWRKPCIIFIAGQSGEGKSFAALRIQELLLEMLGLNISEYLNDINVYTAIEYPQKLNAIMHDPRLRKLNIICVHEARNIIQAKDWHSFLNRAIADINAQSRSVKRLIIIIISQSLKDVDSDIRSTINYYCRATRPMGQRTRLVVEKTWIDDRDFEKIKIRHKKVFGYIVDPKKKYHSYRPDYFEVQMPPREICRAFDHADTAAKSHIIKNKMDQLIKKLKKDLKIGEEEIKLDAMLKYYTENTENLRLVMHITKRGKIKLKPDFVHMHELTDLEKKKFTEMLQEKLKEIGLIEDMQKEVIQDGPTIPATE